MSIPPTTYPLRSTYPNITGKLWGTPRKIRWGVCGPLPKSLTLCNIPYPIYDLTENLKSYLRPDPKQQQQIFISPQI